MEDALRDLMAEIDAYGEPEDAIHNTADEARAIFTELDA